MLFHHHAIEVKTRVKIYQSFLLTSTSFRRKKPHFHIFKNKELTSNWPLYINLCSQTMLNSIPESFSLHKSKFWNGEKSSKLHEELLVWNSWQKKNMKTEYWIKVLRLKRKKTVMITNCNANYLYVHCLLQLYLLQKSSLAIIPSFKSYFIIPNKLNMFLIIFKIFWESLCTEYCPFKLCEAIKWK